MGNANNGGNLDNNINLYNNPNDKSSNPLEAEFSKIIETATSINPEIEVRKLLY